MSKNVREFVEFGEKTKNIFIQQSIKIIFMYYSHNINNVDNMWYTI